MQSPSRGTSQPQRQRFTTRYLRLYFYRSDAAQSIHKVQLQPGQAIVFEFGRLNSAIEMYGNDSWWQLASFILVLVFKLKFSRLRRVEKWKAKPFNSSAFAVRRPTQFRTQKKFHHQTVGESQFHNSSVRRGAIGKKTNIIWRNLNWTKARTARTTTNSAGIIKLGARCLQFVLHERPFKSIIILLCLTVMSTANTSRSNMRWIITRFAPFISRQPHCA